MFSKNKLKKIMTLILLTLLISVLFMGCIGENNDNDDNDKSQEQEFEEKEEEQEQKEEQIIKDISNSESFQMINENKSNPNVIILDVRTQDEFLSGHIENASNIDFYSETFSDELNKLDKNKTYLIYCRTANRSGQALGMMEDLGFLEVYNMLGGIVEWEANGYPIVYE